MSLSWRKRGISSKTLLVVVMDRIGWLGFLFVFMCLIKERDLCLMVKSKVKHEL